MMKPRLVLVGGTERSTVMENYLVEHAKFSQKRAHAFIVELDALESNMARFSALAPRVGTAKAARFLRVFNYT